MNLPPFNLRRLGLRFRVGGLALTLAVLPWSVHSESPSEAARTARPIKDQIKNGSTQNDDPELVTSPSGQLIVNPSALRGARLKLRLPNGQTVTCVRDRTETENLDTFAWVGHIDREPLSRVTIGSANGTLAGSVDRSAYTPGERWHLLPNGGGTYTFTAGSGVDFTCATGPTPPRGRGNTAPTGLSVSHTSAADSFVSGQAQPNVVDLLVVYSAAARVSYGASGLTAMAIQAVADANTTLGGSYANTLIKLVQMQEVAHVESTSADINTVLGRLVVAGDGYLDAVPPLRDQYGADLVTLISEDVGASGVAYIPYLSGIFHPEYAYNIVNDNFLVGGSLTHEIGHNLGCNHDRNHLNNAGQSVNPYAFGYQSCATDALGFRDIMAYECTTGDTSQRLNYFSSPWLAYLGRPLGIDYASDPVNASDNARSIRETGPTVASFRSSVQPLPLALSGLTLSAPAFNTVALAWSTPDSTTAGVELQRSSDGGTTWNSVAFLPGAATSWLDRPLTAATPYSYRVRSFNSAGSGTFSASASLTTPVTATVPSAPTGLTGQEITKGRIDLSWTDAANNEEGYRIERSDSGAAFMVLATLGWDATGFNDGVGLQMGHAYAYRIFAYNAVGDSAVAQVTVAVAILPANPTALSLIPLTSSSVQLKWQDNANNETGFILERSVAGAAFGSLATRTANVTSFTNSSLVAGTTYAYRVWAQNVSGVSATPATASIIWGQAPTAPSALTVTALAAGQISLAWTDASDTEANFSLERAGADNIYSVLATVAANTTAYSDTTVGSATSYSYRLRAANLFGNSAYTTPLAVTSQEIAALVPTAPTGLIATSVTATQVALAWSDQSANETGFLIERATGSGAFGSLATTAANVATFTDSTLTPATAYSYRVSALNATGASTSTAILSVTTLPLPPAAPSGLVASATSSTQVNLSWVDNSANETGFQIERSTSGGTYSQIGTSGANSPSYIDTRAAAGVTYTYRVRSNNPGGNSAYSPVAAVTTPPSLPAAPSTLTGKAISTSQITLTWQDKSNNETGFRIGILSGSTWTDIGTVGANVKSYTASGLKTLTSYSFRVQSYNSAGGSAYITTTATTK